MTDLQQQTAITSADLANWYNMKNQLAQLKSAESLLRKRIFNFYFPDPDEGTNTFPLKDGTGAEVKGKHVISRDVNEGELEALKAAMAEEGSNLPQVDLSKLIKYKPELNLREYRKLKGDELETFERVLVVKNGSPQLDITIPKSK